MADSPKRTLVTLGLVAAALAALFVASLVCRPGDDSSGSGCAAPRREAWRQRLLGGRAVAPGELSGCTTALGRFTIAGSCELVIAPADARARRLVIEAMAPIELRTVTEADGRRIASRADLEPGKPRELILGEAGQSLQLRCRSGTACAARVE